MNGYWTCLRKDRQVLSSALATLCSPPGQLTSVEPVKTEEIPAKSVGSFSKPELPLLFLICILFLRVTRTYKERICALCCFCQTPNLQIFLETLHISSVFNNIYIYCQTELCIICNAWKQTQARELHLKCPIFFMEDKQAWKRGLITSQLSPLLAHRNVESKETECFCFREPDFKQKLSGRGK